MFDLHKAERFDTKIVKQIGYCSKEDKSNHLRKIQNRLYIQYTSLVMLSGCVGLLAKRAWEGIYIVTKSIQRTPRTKPLIVHHGRLMMYMGEKKLI